MLIYFKKTSDADTVQAKVCAGKLRTFRQQDGYLVNGILILLPKCIQNSFLTTVTGIT